ncbi:MAG TPA: hypothetical protein VFD82_10160 [Planctomycetota bacterium]|nr:hypothetical protein [Planctomycetota bacterium]
MLHSLLPLCLLLPQTPSAKEQRTVFEIHSLQHLCGARAGLETPIWGTMLRAPTDDRRVDLIGVTESNGLFEPDYILQMLQQLNAADREQGRLMLSVHGDCLEVFGAEDGVVRVRQQLEEASAVLMRPLQVEVCAWDATDREIPSAILGPREYAQFAGSFAPLWRCVDTTTNNNAVSMSRERWTRYTRDVNAEVAQKQSISLPVTDAFGEGGRVVVRPHLLLGGDDLVLHVQFGLAQRRGVVRTVPIGMPGAADLEMPLLETAYGGCSGRIVNGGALVVGLRGSAASGGQVAITVRVTARTPPVAKPPAGLAVFPCGALLSTALLQRFELPCFPKRSETDSSLEPTQGFGSLAEDDLTNLVQTALGQAAEGLALEVRQGLLFVRCEAPQASAIETLLTGLQERLLKTVTIRHVGRLLPIEGDTAEQAHKSHPLLHEITAPTLLGRELTIARILETNVVQDLQAAIAQEAAMLDPVLAELRLGTWLQARVAPQGAGLHLLLRTTSAGAPIPMTRSVQPGGGILMLTDMASCGTSHDGPAVAGQAIEHGDGPATIIEGRTYRSVLVTTISQ